MNSCQIWQGDCRTILPTLEEHSVQCCVTSPPYWGLRDYGTASWEGGDAGCEHVERLARQDEQHARPTSGPTRGGSPKAGVIQYRQECVCGARRIDSQLGLESAPEEYVTKMVAVFREVWRVLRDDGVLWLNMGDSYASSSYGGRNDGDIHHRTQSITDAIYPIDKPKNGRPFPPGLKPKDLVGIPWRLAFALQADGWYLRSDIIWHKPNPMPESVTDRPTKAHEYIFLLTKNGGNPLIWKARDTNEWSYDPDLSETVHAFDHPHSEPYEVPRWKGFDYFYDADAIWEQTTQPERIGKIEDTFSTSNRNSTFRRDIGRSVIRTEFRNKRSVWTIATQPYADAHFATFPEEIPKLCILAGSKLGDTVLDPFAGSGTVGKVALELGRKTILIELNPDYISLANHRTFVTPGFL